VCGVALDCLDEVRNEVGTTLHLHRDVAPGLVDADVEFHEAVVGRPEVDATMSRTTMTITTIRISMR